MYVEQPGLPPFDNERPDFAVCFPLFLKLLMQIALCGVQTQRLDIAAFRPDLQTSWSIILEVIPQSEAYFPFAWRHPIQAGRVLLRVVRG